MRQPVPEIPAQKRAGMTNNRNASGIPQYEERHAMDGVAGIAHRDVCYS
ncbi:hypothetical protein [Alteromonas lipolytica]|nr:hypothetical protein [Alteromonas lipolytica]